MKKVILLASLFLSVALVTFGVETNSPAPKILSRDEWKAKPPVAEMKKHSPKHITIHHTATKQKPDRSLAEKLRALQEFSQKPGKLGNGKDKPAWPDVPYHYYIDCHGGIAEGRDVNFVGDTNTEYDPTGHILVVLEGNFEEEKVTEEQLESLRRITRWLMSKWKVPAKEIGGHKDYAKTQCPGKGLHDFLPKLRNEMEPATSGADKAK